MLELDGLVALLMLGLWLFCIFDVITSPDGEVRNLPKFTWLFLVIILFEIGAILWLIAGRPKVAGTGAMPYRGNTGVRPDRPVRQPRPSRPSRSVAPDDDPEFLAQLKKSNSEHESMLSQWEADLRKREEELKKRPEDPTA